MNFESNSDVFMAFIHEMELACENFDFCCLNHDFFVFKLTPDFLKMNF